MASREERISTGLAALPADVITALVDSGASAATIEAVATAARRAAWKRESNRTTDTARRKTISARLPGREVAYYRAIAEASGRSMYRFVADALKAEADRTRDQMEACQQITIDGWRP